MDVGEYHAPGAASDPQQRRVFAGHEQQQQTGLVYMNARWMDPETGTFLSVDPVVANYADPQSYNAYSYARNNPVSFTDPTGMTSIETIYVDGGTVMDTSSYALEVPTPGADGGYCGFCQDKGFVSEGTSSGAASHIDNITVHGASSGDWGYKTQLIDNYFEADGTEVLVYTPINAGLRVAQRASQSDPTKGQVLESNPADRDAILGSVDHARDMVEFNKQLPEPRGSALIRNPDGKLERTAAEPYTLTKGKVNVGGVGWKQAPKNTAAIAGSSVLWARTGHVLRQASTFNGVSANLGGIPVYVLAPYDQQIVVFEQGLEPRLWNP